MNRTIANIIIDIVAAFLFLGMIATGYLLRFPLPPGSNKRLKLMGRPATSGAISISGLVWGFWWSLLFI